MLVVMQNHATQEQIDRVVKTIEEMGYAARPMPGETRTTVGLVGNDGRVDGSRVEALPGVAEVIHVSKPYKQVSREWREENTIVTIAPGVSFGGTDIVIIAGPCSVSCVPASSRMRCCWAPITPCTACGSGPRPRADRRHPLTADTR